MQTRIHVNLNVADLDRSIAFYTRLFGAGPSKVRADYANWRLDQPALHLALVSKPEHAKDHGGEHFGVELFESDELNGWRARAEAAGVTARVEEQVTCCYAVADKWWAADPDGNEWEFWVRSEDAEAMHGEMPLETVEPC
ncbi:MAG: ArsI/CadI family heavy metal resistance metalloenzyme [Planctomycetota bacterium]|nr:ArsI/CadI family heavy metal resistance metalloenzyme [Planctomycetota bacterium]